MVAVRILELVPTTVWICVEALLLRAEDVLCNMLSKEEMLPAVDIDDVWLPSGKPEKED